MKQFTLTILFAMLSWSAQAQLKIAQYDFAQTKGSNTQFITANILDNGKMNLTMKESSAFQEPNLGVAEAGSSLSTLEVSIELSEYNFSLLKRKISILSSYSIVTTYYDVVCSMMPGPAMSTDHLYVDHSYDKLTGNFGGNMQLIHGPTGCWLSTRVSLDNQWANIQASEIKTTLRILANEYLAL